MIGFDVILIAILFYILGIGTKAFLSWYQTHNHPIDGVAFFDSGRERFVMTITYREAKLKDYLIFQVHTEEDGPINGSEDETE